MSKEEWIWRIPSTSVLGKHYCIWVDPDTKRVGCTCRGFKTHKRCKHIRFYKKLIKELMK